MKTQSQDVEIAESDNVLAVFLIFLRLGLTSFGGPVAHLGYFHEEFVNRRRWLGERRFADLVALCQFLPGPASSQVGISLGLSRAGYPGALAAWTGFTLPSAVIMVLFGLGFAAWGDVLPPGLLHGLQVAAVAVVAQAVWGMARKLCTDVQRVTLAAVSTCVLLAWPTGWSQVGVIAAAAMIGTVLFKPAQTGSPDTQPIAVGRPVAAGLLALFFILLVVLPVLAEAWPDKALVLFDAFYRTGSLVFGGGHVVLPLLQSAVVPTGWVTNEAFLAGYGAAQALPGPLFTFAGFLGAAMSFEPHGWRGGLLCLLAIFMPSFLLVGGALPFWERLRHNLRMQAALAGVNAAVVGLLLAALYRPVWTSAVTGPADFGLALVAFVALKFWNLPPWSVVIGSALGGWLLGASG
jgi:chromate transporter